MPEAIGGGDSDNSKHGNAPDITIYGGKGTAFAPLCLQAKKEAKSSILVVWKKISGAKKYIVYANTCGKDSTLKKVKTTTGTSFKLTKLNGKKLKKGTYYKFMVAAFDADNKVITVSKILHAATAGGKAGNPGKVRTKKKAKTVKLKKSKTYQLVADTVGIFAAFGKFEINVAEICFPRLFDQLKESPLFPDLLQEGA